MLLGRFDNAGNAISLDFVKRGCRWSLVAPVFGSCFLAGVVDAAFVCIRQV